MVNMKKWFCDGCGKEIEVYEEYEREYCCNGVGCGCMGKHINPIFCDECIKKIYGN